MFSFNESNSYPLSYYHSHENHNTFLQQNHHQNLFLGLPSLLNPPPILENSINNNYDMNAMINYPSNVMNNNNNLTRKRSGGVKKDRHTKISTAQGVRDRRVRLSLTIARDFFNLQDMLGFDKASKTLGWLLSKSKAAIDELASTLKKNTSEGEVVAQNINKEIKDEKELVLSEETSRKKMRGRKEKCNFQVDSREVMRRAKARERARERTKRKKMIINLNHHLLENSSSSSSHQYYQKPQHNLMICQSNTSTSSYIGGTINPEISVEESVVIKNKLRSGSSFHNYNDNHEMSSKDYQEGCNYYNDYLTKFASESQGGILRQPGFPALNIINLSTEIHINGKPWDTSSNQILH